MQQLVGTSGGWSILLVRYGLLMCVCACMLSIEYKRAPMACIPVFAFMYHPPLQLTLLLNLVLPN